MPDIADDPDLLELMMLDAAEAPAAYQPTNYWRHYESRLLDELRSLGLAGFRGRRGSLLPAMGAADLLPAAPSPNLVATRLGRPPLDRFRYWIAILVRLSRLLSSLPISGGISYERFRRLVFNYAEAQGELAGAKPLRSVAMSRAGDPEDVLEVGGNAYSRGFLEAYTRYAYCSRHVDFDTISTVVELGSRGGLQIELLKKLHPQLTILAFDIAPPLYVCEQDLKAVFPDAVVSYRETRELTSLGDIPPGSIAILGTQQFSLLREAAVDLFWNAASFQEMEPDVVANYLAIVAESARAVFLHQAERGQSRAATSGEHGVLEPTTFEHYLAAMSNYRLVDLSEAGLDPEYRHAFWERP